MIDNQLQCKYCDYVVPKGLYGNMLAHLEQNHCQEFLKILNKQYFEVSYVPPSERKNNKIWIPFHSSPVSKQKVTDE